MTFASLDKFLNGFYDFFASLTLESVEWLFLSIFSIFTLIISGVLFFHWRRYGLGEKKFALMEVVFLLVSGVLIAIAAININ